MVYNKNWFFYREMAEIINLPPWNIFNFMKRYYFQEKKGNIYVIDWRDQRHRKYLGNRAYLMLLIWENDNIIIAKNEVLYTAPRHLRRSDSFLNKMRYLGAYNLTDNDIKELNLLHPGFALKQLHQWIKISNYGKKRFNSISLYRLSSTWNTFFPTSILWISNKKV